MKIGLSLGISPREPIRRFVELSERAEEQGVDRLWVIDSQLAMKDAYAAMTLGLWQTSRVHFGPGVTNLQTRHLSVTANAIATLSEIGGGRTVVGLGAGDSAVFPLGWRPSRLRDLEEGIHRLRTLLDGGSVTLDGRSVHLSFEPAVRPPIFLAASQPHMLRLAGRVADGVIVMGAANRELLTRQLEFVAEGARESGRSPAEISTDMWVTISIDDGDGTAIDDVRSWASAKARWMSGWDDLPASLERYRPEMDEAARTYEFSDHLSLRASHAASVSDGLATALAVAGDTATCIARLRDLCGVEPDSLTLTLLSGGRERRLQQLMSEIVPTLRHRSPSEST